MRSLSYLIFFLSFAAAVFGAQRSRGWLDWEKKYAAESPLWAHNKVVSPELQIAEDQVKTILAGKSVIHFGTELFLGSKPYKEFDVFEMDAGRNLAIITWYDDQLDFSTTPEDALKHHEREREMLKIMEDLVVNRKADELLVIDAGAYHGIDLYLDQKLKGPDHPYLKRANEILYFKNSTSMSTPFGTDSFRAYESLRDGIPATLRTVKESSLYEASNFLARLMFFRNLQIDRYKFDEIWKRHEVENPGVLVFLDFHELSSVDAIEHLPTATDLKLMGFKTVKLATEQFEAGKEYSSDDYVETYKVTERSLKDAKITDEKVIKYVSNHEIIDHPAQLALHKKLKDWEKAGVKIIYTGNESFQRISYIKPKPTASK